MPRPVVGDTLSKPVTTVPGTTPGPDTGVPTAKRVGVEEVVEVREVTVITVPAMEATKVGGVAVEVVEEEEEEEVDTVGGGAEATNEVRGRV